MKILHALVPRLTVAITTFAIFVGDWARAERKDFGLNVCEYVPAKSGQALKTPTHIAFGPGGQEIITDLKNNRLLYRSGPKEAFKVSPVQLKGPHSVAYNPADKLYYVNDTENHRIIAFADLANAELVAETNVIAGVKLQRPHDVVVDAQTGWVYAINPNSGHVFRFKGIGKEESAIEVPVEGYARALSHTNGQLYAIGSARGRIVEIVDWDAPTFKIHDSYDPAKLQGPAGSWTKTGLVLNDAEFFEGFWYASSYFTQSYAKGTDYDEHKFIRFKNFEDFSAGKWMDLSNLVPSGLTPYYLTVNGNDLFLAIFNHEVPARGDSILKFTTSVVTP